MSEEYNQGEQDQGERDQGGGGAGADVKLDDFVGQVVQDPNQPPDLLLLSGYLGASSEEAHVRLYLDEELSRYVEIPNEAIRHAQPLTAEQSPLGGSLVWIDRSAEVLHGKAGAERNKATFFEGQIAQDFMGEAAEQQQQPQAQGFAAGPGGAGATGSLLCTVITPRCQRTDVGPLCGPSLSEPCETRSLNCPSRWCPRREFAPQNFAAGEGGGVAGAAQTQFALCQPSQLTPCIPQTELGPKCQSQFGPCIPATEWKGCRTLTGIFCTRFGPGCRKTLFEPQCQITTPGLHCPNTLFGNCPSAQICITQDLACQESGFVCQPPGGFTPVDPTIVATATEQALCSRAACGQPFDPTIVQQPFGAAQQFGGQQGFAAGAGAGAGIGAIPVTVVRCPSALIRCQPSQFVSCPSQLIVQCQSSFIRCQTRNLSCPSVAIPCQSRVGGCESQFGVCPSFVDACPSRFGCDSQICFETRGCFTEQFGGGQQFGGQQFGGGQQFAAQPQQAAQANFGAAATATGCLISRPVNCPSAVDACPTRFGCESQVVPCQSQLIRCQSALDACPTRFGCGPSINMPCVTRDLACQTHGQCPSAVDACPTRFGCFETQICVTEVCGASQACEPQFGGGGQEQFAAGGAQPQAAAAAATQFCPSVFNVCPTQSFGCPTRNIRCPSVVAVCPTQFRCPPPSLACPSVVNICTRVGCITRNIGCPTIGACPSAVDACPTRFGCFETAAGCFESRVCGGFDPGDVFGGGGGFGGGGAGGGF